MDLPDRATRTSRLPGAAVPGPGLDILKALGDNTRYAIYLELARSPRPLSTADIAEVLGLHVNTVRPHLERMREVGLLEVTTSSRGDVGRPQHRYSLAADAPWLGLEPSPLPMLARVVLSAAHGSGPVVRRVARCRARPGPGRRGAAGPRAPTPSRRWSTSRPAWASIPRW